MCLGVVLNRLVGNDPLDVGGNNSKISLRDMLESGDWFLVSNGLGKAIVEGGPSNIRHKDFRTFVPSFVCLSFIHNAQATPPGFLNGVDWRALVKD